MRDERGISMVEIVLSIVLSAVMVTAIFGVVLSAKRGGGHEDRRMLAEQVAHQFDAQLRTFVTADPTTTIISGPGTGSDLWSVDPADVCTPTYGGCTCWGSYSGRCYALSPGSHTVTNATYMPSWFTAAPYNAVLTYYVYQPYTYAVFTGSVPLVSVAVTWTEP